MNIELKEPAVQEITEQDPLKRIELVGRTCYNSLSRITETSAEPFVRNLMARGHETPLEAARIVVTEAMLKDTFSRHMRQLEALLPYLDPAWGNVRQQSVLEELMENLAPKWDLEMPNTVMDHTARYRIIQTTDVSGPSSWELHINVRDLLKLLVAASSGRDYAVDALMHMLRYADVRMPDDYATVRIETDRGIGNELVRHRVLAYEDDVISAYTSTADDMSMVQASTRYIKYKDKPVPICVPRPLPFEQGGQEWHTWLSACDASARAYRRLIELGQTPQYARNVLPLSTATTIVMTGTSHQWKAFLELRLDYAAHPQMRHVAGLIRHLPVMERLVPVGTLRTDE